MENCVTNRNINTDSKLKICFRNSIHKKNMWYFFASKCLLSWNHLLIIFAGRAVFFHKCSRIDRHYKLFIPKICTKSIHITTKPPFYKKVMFRIIPRTFYLKRSTNDYTRICCISSRLHTIWNNICNILSGPSGGQSFTRGCSLLKHLAAICKTNI